MERAKSKGTLSWEENLEKAIQNADYVYTDTWLDMEFFNDPSYADKKKQRMELMMPYQINSSLLEKQTRKSCTICPSMRVTKSQEKLY